MSRAGKLARFRDRYLRDVFHVTHDMVLDERALFSIVSGGEHLADLSVRERRLLVGSMNFHALMAPTRRLVVHAYDGGWDSLPRTTDDATFDGQSRAFRHRLFSFEIESLVQPEQREPRPFEGPARRLASGGIRHIHVSLDDVLRYDPPRELGQSPLRAAVRSIRTRWPLVYDQGRDLELLRHRRSLVRPAPVRDYDAEFLPGGIHSDVEFIPAGPAVEGAPRAVIFGLHWFELGGAERWAFESVRIAREAGLLPIVLSNRDSHQPWIDRAELDGAIIIPFSEPTVRSQTPGVEELLRALLRTFDVRGVFVHHNQWLYDRLPWIARSRPGIPLIDSTHIVEYRGGGYPVSSALAAASLTTHHVISPALARWMTEVQRIPSEKVVMAPLGGLTVKPKDAVYRARHADEPFTVAFIGRMSRQKAPEVFVEMAARISHERPDVRFIMHGDGEMASWVDALIDRGQLRGVVVRRSSGDPVEKTLADSHLLVVTSHNEGLTLTTLEAVAQGVPVVSTDAGAQSDIVPDRALVSRNAFLAVREGAKKVLWLAGDEDARHELWRDERKAEKRLLSQTSASAWFEAEVATW